MFFPLVSMLQYAGYLEAEGSYTLFYSKHLRTLLQFTTVQSLLI